MKLIDADALFINLDGMMAVSPTGYIHGDTVADMISDAPTVDAIPIEFIRERMKCYYENGYTAEFGACLEALIEDWRKEAERKEE